MSNTMSSGDSRVGLLHLARLDVVPLTYAHYAVAPNDVPDLKQAAGTIVIAQHRLMRIRTHSGRT